MKHVLGGMSFPELLMRSIHAESTCVYRVIKSEYSPIFVKKIFFESICFEHKIIERKSDPKQILSSIYLTSLGNVIKRAFFYPNSPWMSDSFYHIIESSEIN